MLLAYTHFHSVKSRCTLLEKNNLKKNKNCTEKCVVVSKVLVCNSVFIFHALIHEDACRNGIRGGGIDEMLVDLSCCEYLQYMHITFISVHVINTSNLYLSEFLQISGFTNPILNYVQSSYIILINNYIIIFNLQ